MKVLVTGAAGCLGTEVVCCLQEKQVECLGVDIEDFDVRDGAAVHQAVQAYAPDVIVHCAAYTAAEQAETEPEKCAEVNGIGTLNVVRAALAVDAKLLYVSDAAVFSGTGTEPWEINDRPNARGVYGLTKAQGEEAVRSLMTRYFIVRSSWLFGGKEDFVAHVCRRSAEKGEIAVSAVETAAPTWVSELAALLCDMLQTERYGVYHAAGQGYCSKAELTQAVVRMTRGRLSIREITTPSGGGRKPANGRLSTISLAQNGFRPLSHWEDALKRYLSVTID